MTDRPVVQLDSPGCPVMPQVGAGQFDSCKATPRWTVIQQAQHSRDRWRLFVCDGHRNDFDHAQPMTDEDRSELDGRILAWDRAKAGQRWESVGPVDDEL